MLYEITITGRKLGKNRFFFYEQTLQIRENSKADAIKKAINESNIREVYATRVMEIKPKKVDTTFHLNKDESNFYSSMYKKLVEELKRL